MDASVSTAQIRPGKMEECLDKWQEKVCKKTVKDYSRIARRITVTLFATQSLVSAAFVVSGTVSAIVGAQLSGNPAWAGVPSSPRWLWVRPWIASGGAGG
jgi:hypothetical protein